MEKTVQLDPKVEGVGALTNVKRLIIKIASAENRVTTLSGDSQPKATLDAARVAFAQKAATPA